MSRSKKIALGIFTFWPIFYYILLAIMAVCYFIFESPLQDNLSRVSPIFFGFPIFTLAVMIALIVTYIIIIKKNNLMPKDTKILWIVLVVVFQWVAMPIYFCIYICRKPKDTVIYGSTGENPASI